MHLTFPKIHKFVCDSSYFEQSTQDLAAQQAKHPNEKRRKKTQQKYYIFNFLQHQSVDRKKNGGGGVRDKEKERWKDNI